MSRGSESISSLTRVLPWAGVICSVAAAQELKLQHHEIRLDIKSFLQASHCLSMVVQQSLELLCQYHLTAADVSNLN